MNLYVIFMNMEFKNIRVEIYFVLVLDEERRSMLQTNPAE